MNFFSVKTSWSNAELAILKIFVASAYILIGSHFHRFFNRYSIPIFIVFLISVVWLVYLWLIKMKNESQSNN